MFLFVEICCINKGIPAFVVCECSVTKDCLQKRIWSVGHEYIECEVMFGYGPTRGGETLKPSIGSAKVIPYVGVLLDVTC